MASPAPQLTARAIILAIVLAMILAAANTYLGLFAGMTIASAIPAAVVSMAVLRVLGGGGILENNIVQTGASAGTSIASGVIFTVPALVLMGYWPDFKYWWVLAIAGLGGLLRRAVLGAAAPLADRRAADDASPKARRPRKCCAPATTLRQGVKVLGLAALGGGVGKLFAASGLRLIPDSSLASGFIGKYLGYMGTNLSPALLGVGYIVGLNIGCVVVLGQPAVVQHRDPDLPRVFPAAQPGARRGRRGRLPGDLDRGMRGSHGADPARRADPLSRRRRDAGRRTVGADHACAVRSCRACKSGLAAARAGSDTLSHTPSATCR